MKCIECGSRAYVIDSREPKDNGNNGWSKYLIEEADDAVSWYCRDYRARRYICKSCGEKLTTIEMTVEDLKEAFLEAAEQFGSKRKLQSIA